MNIALILAGGIGSRLGGDVPKQFLDVNGCPVIAYCLKTFEDHEWIDVIQVVADQKWRPLVQKYVEKKPFGFSEPGATRQLSIWNGLEDLKEIVHNNDIVIIHDAARPLVSGDLLTKGIEALKTHDGVLPVLPMKDTVYYSAGGMTVTSLLDRNCVVAGQAPEFFRFGTYYEANRALIEDDRILAVNGSTEPAVMAGMDIALIEGDENNFKITTANEMERFEHIINRKNV